MAIRESPPDEIAMVGSVPGRESSSDPVLRKWFDSGHASLNLRLTNIDL